LWVEGELKNALVSGRGVTEIVIEKGLLTRLQLDEILQPAMLTQPRVALGFGDR
jgi:aspartate ammonia-lyase